MTVDSVVTEFPVNDLVGLGRALGQARLAKTLSVESVAAELHLQSRQIEAMERGDFSNFSSPAFVKGHLRACAKLYGVDGDRLVNLYQSFLPPPKDYAPAIVAPVRKNRLVTHRESTRAALLWAAAVAIVLVVFLLANSGYLGMTSWSFSSQPEEAGSSSPNEALDVSGKPDAVISSDVLMASNSNLQDAAVAGTVLPASDAVQPGIAPSAIPDESSLHIEFIDDCWVQIKSGDGKVLHEKLHKKGDVFDLQANPPLHLWLGRAAAVNVGYNGVVVTVPVKPGMQSVQFVIGDEQPSGEVE